MQLKSKGFTLIALDYSQIELRVLAHFSEDDSLVHTFLSEGDIHRRTAAEIFGVTEDEVSAIFFGPAWTLNEPEPTCEFVYDGSRANDLRESQFIDGHDGA
mgnify:CR=1 FL=1